MKLYDIDQWGCRVDVSRAQWRASVKAVADDLIQDGPLVFPPVVGMKEIRRMFGVKDNTPYQWRAKHIIPKEDGTISNNPVWKVTTVYRWAKATGRTIIWHPWPGFDGDGTASEHEPTLPEV